MGLQIRSESGEEVKITCEWVRENPETMLAVLETLLNDGTCPWFCSCKSGMTKQHCVDRVVTSYMGAVHDFNE